MENEEDEYGNKSCVAPFTYPKSYVNNGEDEEVATSPPVIKR